MILNHFNSWLLQSKIYLCHVFYCLSEFQNWIYISLLLTLFSVTHVCCKGTTVCWWTLEGSEECVRCLITTNREAFRCVSDSFTTHVDPLSLSEEACPLKERENTAALSCRNAGMWGISSNQSLFSWSRLIKTVNCNISEAVSSLPGTTFWLTSPVNDFKSLNWRFQRRDSPQSSSDSAPSVGPAPASHHRDRQYRLSEKK